MRQNHLLPKELQMTNDTELQLKIVTWTGSGAQLSMTITLSKA